MMYAHTAVSNLREGDVIIYDYDECVVISLERLTSSEYRIRLLDREGTAIVTLPSRRQVKILTP